MKGSLVNTIKNSLVYLLGSFFVRLATLVLLPLLTDANYLSVEEFGRYTLIDITANFFVIIMGLGLYMGFTRFYWDDAYKQSQKSMHFNTLLVTTGFTIVCLIGLWLAAPLFSMWLFDIVTYAFSFRMAFLFAAFMAIMQVPRTLMKLRSKSTYYSMTSVVNAFSTLLFVWYFLVKAKMGLDGIFIGMALSAFVTLLSMSVFVVKNIKWTLDLAYLKSVFRYTYPMLLSSIIAAILGLLDRFVLNAHSSLEDVAVYSIGFKLSNTIKILVISSIQLALSPLMMKKMNDPKHTEFYPRVLRLFSVGLMFVILGMVFFSKELISLFTHELIYLDAAVIVTVLSFGFFFQMMKDTVVVGLTIEKRTMTIGLITLLTTLLSILMYRLGVYYFDKLGAAGAFLLSQIVYFGLMLYFAQKTHFIPYKFGSVLVILMSGIVLVGASFLMKDWSPLMNVIGRVVLWMMYPAIIIITGVFKWNEVLGLKNELLKK